MGNALGKDLTNEEIRNQTQPTTFNNTTSSSSSSSTSSTPSTPSKDVIYYVSNTAKEGYIPAGANPKDPNTVLVYYNQYPQTNIGANDITGGARFIPVQSNNNTPAQEIGQQLQTIEGLPNNAPIYQILEHNYANQYMRIKPQDIKWNTPNQLPPLSVQQRNEGVAQQYNSQDFYHKTIYDLTTLTNYKSFYEAPASLIKAVAVSRLNTSNPLNNLQSYSNPLDILKPNVQDTRRLFDIGAGYYQDVKGIYGRREEEQYNLKQQYGNTGGSLIYTATSEPALYLIGFAGQKVLTSVLPALTLIPNASNIIAKVGEVGAPTISDVFGPSLAIGTSTAFIGGTIYGTGGTIDRFQLAGKRGEGFVGQSGVIGGDIVAMGIVSYGYFKASQTSPLIANINTIAETKGVYGLEGNPIFTKTGVQRDVFKLEGYSGQGKSVV